MSSRLLKGTLQAEAIIGHKYSKADVEVTEMKIALYTT